MSRLIEESHNVRRIVGQLTHGEDLCRGLLAVCQQRAVRCARVEAQGVLSEIDLACYDAENRGMGKPRRFRTVAQLLTGKGMVTELDGQLHLELNLVLARQTDNGLAVLGGSCSAARVIACQFVIDVHDDLIIRQGIDRGSGLLQWQQMFGAGESTATAAPPAHPTDRQAPESEEGSKVSWADAVMASVRAVEPESVRDPGPNRPVNVGDFLEHQKFGRCEVQRVDADQEYVTVRLRNSRLVRLNLEVLKLRYTGDEEGHQVFSAAPQSAGA